MIEKYGVFWLHLRRCLLNKATLIRRYSVTTFAYLVSKESSTIVDALLQT